METSPRAMLNQLSDKPLTLIQKKIHASAVAFYDGNFSLALSELSDALELHPDQQTEAQIYQAISVNYVALKNLTMADVYCDLSIDKSPKRNADFFSQKSIIACQMHDYKKASYYANIALSLRATPKVLTNAGVLCLELNEPARAEKVLKLALAQQPDLPEAHLNLAFALFSQGKNAEAWQHQEYRFLTHSGMGYSSFAPPWPLWRGEPLKGKRLYVKTEQGKGDTLKFMRYINFVKAMGADVVIDCDNDMRPLMEIVFADCHFIDRDQGERIACDYWIWLMSIGQFWKGIPTHTPYVISGLLRPRDERFTVGLCWRGNPDQGDDWKRSMFNDEMMEFAASLPNSVSLISLQYGYEFQPDDWFETSQHIHACDLVITVDTSIAHLAGAMNKPTWVLLSAAPSYHYPSEGDTNPWYPSQRLYRQEGIKDLGNWQNVLKKVGQDLRTMLQNR